MKKDEVFTFTAPNGAVVLGVVIDIISYETHRNNPDLHIAVYLCYAQNRIFKCYSINHFGESNESSYLEFPEGYIVVDYAVLPDYDNVLEMANDMYEEDVITSYLEREC